jgi:phosphoglycolate phosphatase-like HAD superfamily hydrolase
MSPPTQIRPSALMDPTLMNSFAPWEPPSPDDVACVEDARWDVATANTARAQIAWIPWGRAKLTQPRQADFLSLISQNQFA